MSRNPNSVMSARTGGRTRESSLKHDFQQQVIPPGEYHLTPTWPQTRLVRQAQTEPYRMNLDWDDYLKDLGKNNYGKGRAHSLGSIAIVYVGGKDMGRMLEEKYPKAYRSPDHTSDVHRKIRKNIGRFITEAYGHVQYAVADQAETAYALLQRSLLVTSFSNELAGDEEAFIGAVDDHAPEEMLPDLNFRSPQDMRQDWKTGQLIFGPAAFDSPGGIQPFGKNNYGVDLRLNEQIYDERSAFLRFLHDEEGLNTTSLFRDGWAAHASIFTTEEHLRFATLESGLTKPDSLVFDAPRAL